MDFGFSQEISEDVIHKGDVITLLSFRAEDFFREKDFGEGIQTLIIGFICVHPDFDFFFKKRKKYTKEGKVLEYDIKLNHEKFKDATEQGIKELIAMEIKESLKIISDLKIENFDVERFEKDLYMFLNNELCI